MANLTPSPDFSFDTGDGMGMAPDRRSPTGTPGWVKVLGIIGLVLVLLFVVLQFVDGEGHGPGRHSPGSETSPFIRIDDGGHTPPEGGHR